MGMHDVIVIGGGHNGLTTAASLAAEGKKVLVVEQREVLGGIASSEEFHPGYRTNGLLHDTGSVRTDVIDNLSLRKNGLQTAGRRAPVTLLSDDGRAATIYRDADRSAESLAKISSHDAEAYRKYREFIDSVSPLIRSVLSEPQPDLLTLAFSDLRQLLMGSVRLRRLGKTTMMELLKVLPMSVADFLNEKFETEFVKAGIAGPAILGTFNGPWSSYTTMNLLLWEATARETITGGPAQLVSALQQAARGQGVEIRTAAPVKRILLDDSGNTKGVVLESGEKLLAPIVAASCTPKTTFLDLLKSSEVGPTLESEIGHVRCRGTAAKINIALDRPVQWKASVDDRAEYLRTGNSIDEMEQAFDAVKYRQVSESPVLDIHVPMVSNKGLAPEGHEVLSILAGFAPYNHSGGWTSSAKEELQKRVLSTLSSHTVNLKDSIVGVETLTPEDLESRYGLTGGDLFHGEQSIDQLVGRPVPSCAGYKTPIPGLFLCGSGSHPGGGITCGPGFLASQAILSSTD